MKLHYRIISILCLAAMAFALTACGNNGNKGGATTAAPETTTAAPTEAETEAPAEEETEAPAEAETDAPAETETEEAAQTGDLTPEIVIEYGDAEAIQDLAKKAQSFEVAEGTVVQISGVFNSGAVTPSIQEKDADGKYKGINLYVDGDWEKPADKTDIDVIGTFVKGANFMELHVSAENITIK